MIYVDNLSEFIRSLIEDSSQGLYCPQNKKLVNMSDLVMEIAKIHGHKIKLTSFLNPLLNLLNLSILNKVFGDLLYDRKIEDSKKIYCNSFIYFKSSIKLTEE